MLAELRSEGNVTGEVALQVVTGNGWDQALDSVEWEDGELLVLGTTRRRSVRVCFWAPTARRSSATARCRFS
jgi:nucleotide-binding universal stress UspA family protein